MTELPYGRAARKGEDAFASQMEAYALRQQAISQSCGNVLSPMASLTQTGSTTISGSFASGVTRVIPLAIQNHQVLISQARARVIALSAGSTMGACLYALDRSAGGDVFQKIDPSFVLFNTSVVSTLTVDLKSPVLIPERTQIALAVYLLHGGAAPVITALNFGTSTTLFPSYQFPGTNLPDRLRGASLQPQVTSAFPMVAYVSPDIAEVF